MTTTDARRVVFARRPVAAPPEVIFDLIADPARQPEWDGNDNLSSSAAGQRVHAVGDAFDTVLTNGQVRRNHVVEFEEGRLIAWQPSPVDEPRPGHLWRWEVTPTRDGSTVTHTYDWTDLHDEARQVRARATTVDKLAASLDRLAELAERSS
ncbi:hypothetical protein nbrc107696_30340 [Gordonia spumicola]|uniref:Polyketide cyclase n=1 Tax=Gordonia spumicola TaxID=589161 RepID=A0A7I9VB40_9ACTN|nr:SRPBCC family protein [Gordonia spumicola]GEE02588.1 hypothetical protein nbrc107696_30340 [Gordonia spumicola]